MNNNIKETTSLVFVKGKNLFNKNNVLNGYRFGSDGALYAESGFFATDFIEVNSNTQYTVSWAIQTTQCVCYYDENKNFISRNSSNQTFITPANCKYIRASVFNGVINSAQIEQGTTATTYQEYVENQIYIKNKNEVFEKFYNEKNNIIGKIINEKGTAIKYADGTLVCYGNIEKNLNITQSYEGVYFGGTGSIFYPVPFVNTPVVNLSAQQNNSLLTINIAGSAGDAFSAYVWKNQSKSNVQLNVHYIAIGYWK